MPDQPLLQPRRIAFQMELQAEREVLDREGLMRAQRRRREARAPGGDLELVAVPVQHRLALRQRRERRFAAGVGQGQRREADLLAAMRHRPHRCAERPRHQLRAQADAQQRPPRGEAPTDQRQLVVQIRIQRVVIRADRAAEHHEQVDRVQVHVPQVVHAGVPREEAREAARLEHRPEQAEVFESQVAQGQDGLGRGHDAGATGAREEGERRVSAPTRPRPSSDRPDDLFIRTGSPVGASGLAAALRRDAPAVRPRGPCGCARPAPP